MHHLVRLSGASPADEPRARLVEESSLIVTDPNKDQQQL
jgi:hypothetical protein